MIIASAPSAALLVELYPAGIPGKVLVAVRNTGPERLSPAEAVKVLADAADSVRQTWPGGETV